MTQYETDIMSSQTSNFLARITNIRLQAFKRNTIKASFRKTGLLSFNPEIVMQKLQELLPANIISNLSSTSHTPTQVLREIFFNTSTTICAISLHASALINIK